MKILSYNSSQIYNRQRVLKKLYTLTNYTDSPGIGSGMTLDLDRKVNGKFFLAWLDQKIVGWAIVTKRTEHELQIAVYVDQNYRKRGIGTALCEKAKIFAKLQQKLLCCNPWSDAGKQMFNKVGFLNKPYTFTYN